MSDANDPHHMAVSECVTMAQILTDTDTANGEFFRARYLARNITDTANGTKYAASMLALASNARIAMWLIEDVRSLTQQMINIISNDAHSQ